MNNHSLNSEILNVGITLAMEFGKNWLQPIQERLSIEFPALKIEELDIYDKVCSNAMHNCHRKLREILMSCSEQNKEILYSNLFEIWKNEVVKKYDWLNEDLLRPLFNQGMYYSWKNGYTGCVKDK